MSTQQKVNVGPYKVGPIGTGFMNLTAFRPKITPDEQAFAVAKAAFDGGSTFWNSATFYGNPPHLLANLEFLSRFFTANPGISSQITLSVKGCTHIGPQGFKFDATPEAVEASISEAIGVLEPAVGKERKEKGLPVLDLFESSRIVKEVPIELTVGQLKKEVEKGRIGAYGLSEASAETIRRAHKVHPVGAVEIEYSLWATEAEDNGVFAACKELGVPVIAYSPIGRGFLTGTLRSVDDLPKDDFRRHLERFHPDNFAKNLELVDRITEFAKKKGVTPAQLAISWARARGAKLGVTVIPIPGSTRVEQTKENVEPVDISDAELTQIQKILDDIKPVGGRYSKQAEEGGMQLYGDTISLEEYEKTKGN